ncbi:MAG: hypothetical protein AB7T10_05805 [bacterium]
MIFIALFVVVLMALILFISKRRNVKDKIFGLCYFYVYFNIFAFYLYKIETDISILSFMNLANITFFLFVLFLLKYLTEGEN